jgi:hypothetical protein
LRIFFFKCVVFTKSLITGVMIIKAIKDASKSVQKKKYRLDCVVCC